MSDHQSGVRLTKRLRSYATDEGCIRGTHYIPLHLTSVREIIATIEGASAALRWIYEHGLPPEHSRPAFVSEAIDRAFDGHRFSDAAANPKTKGEA